MINLNLKEKSFDDKVILKDISLQIEKGDILSITGQSGIGKSTLLRILTGLDTDFKGEITNTFKTSSISFPEKVFLGRISAIKEIKLVSRASNSEIEKAMEYFDLLNLKNNLVKTMSTGQKTRLSLIRSILSDSEIIYLDEPLMGLDFNNKKLATDYIVNNLKGRALVYTGASLNFKNEKIIELTQEN